MCWNPPDPSDYVDQKLGMEEDELGIRYLYLPDGDPFEIRVFHTDGTPIIEEFWSIDDFNTRLDDLKQERTKYEIVCGPEVITF